MASTVLMVVRIRPPITVLTDLNATPPPALKRLPAPPNPWDSVTVRVVSTATRTGEAKVMIPPFIDATGTTLPPTMAAAAVAVQVTATDERVTVP